MASRQLLPVIRAARAGDAEAQLALGRHYLFGGGGLPRSPTSALHWLDRAARRDRAEAWRLIGEHIHYETARTIAPVVAVLPWYEKACDAGVLQAGVTFARLVMNDAALRTHWHDKAMRALIAAAKANIPDAQWLLAQQSAASRDAPSVASGSGSLAARYALAERAWDAADYTAFLRWSLPLARELVQRVS